MNKGFTLIEVIIYIALFSLLLGTAFVATYQLIDSSRKLSAKTITEEEGNFVMRKINWALTNVNPGLITIPSAGTPISNTLTMTKYDSNKISIQLNGTKIEMRESENGNTFLPITTDNVTVSGLDFKYKTLGGITATTVINGITFTITKYFRK